MKWPILKCAFLLGMHLPATDVGAQAAIGTGERVVEVPECPMPVRRLEAVDGMPVLRLETSEAQSIRVAPPTCENPLAPADGESAVVGSTLPSNRSQLWTSGPVPTLGFDPPPMRLRLGLSGASPPME